MRSLESIGLDPGHGELLKQAAYKADFRQRELASDGQDSWKLERRQDFRQPGTPSWESFARGDWGEALRLIEERRDALTTFSEESRRRGIGLYRVRIVEKPIIPYVQWELHSLRVRAECGEMIRVVGPEAVHGLEQQAPLPELINLGSETLYEIRYDEQGIANGAVRYTDTHLVARFVKMCRELYELGEDVEEYFEREVAHLPPPARG